MLDPRMRPQRTRDEHPALPRLPLPRSKPTWRGTYVHGPRYGLAAQQVVVKTSYARPSTRGFRSFAGMTAQKLRYLRRDPQSQELPIYTHTRDQLNQQERSHFASRTQGDPLQWNIILSPERGKDIDLTHFTRTFMQRVERDTGLTAHGLDWVAVNHYDTPHPHTHVVLRGRTHNNEQEVTLTRDYLSRGMPYRARDIATDLLGPRDLRLQEHERLLERLSHTAHELEMTHDHSRHLEHAKEHTR